MANRSDAGKRAGTRCTIQKWNGEFCDAASVEGSPYPICVKHGARIFEFFREQIDIATWTNPLMVMVELSARGRHATIDEATEVVYYVRCDSLIKIGYTTNLTNRLKAYLPGSVVLATENGTRELERERHAQFKADLAYGREWFLPSVELVEHINTLRDTPLSAADLAA